VAKVGGMAGTMIARTASGSPQRTQLPSQELLDDLCSRFVLNVPEEELQAFERILFSVEQAHWFYEDNAMEQNMALKSLSLREFTSLMFQSCAALRPYITHIDDIYKDFTTYKTRVPVMGAIILDETLERCLLVKGWKAGGGSLLRFPGGPGGDGVRHPSEAEAGGSSGGRYGPTANAVVYHTRREG
jgi:mRNA-decapping enzyme subunit 2